MSYKITITNNKTGEILADEDNAVAIVGAIADEKKVAQIYLASCNALTLASVIHGAEDIISLIKRESPEVDASLRFMEVMEKKGVAKQRNKQAGRRRLFQQKEV